APGSDRQPGHRLDRGGGSPREGELPLLRGQARDLRRAFVLFDRRAVPAGRRALQRGPRRGRRQITGQLLMESSAGPRRLAVLGHPVGDSRSPAMQTAALEALGLAGEWSYEAIDVAPDGFGDLVLSLPAAGFAGANVTVPHKGAALAVADERSEGAREIRAGHTPSFAAGRRAA